MAYCRVLTAHAQGDAPCSSTLLSHFQLSCVAINSGLFNQFLILRHNPAITRINNVLFFFKNGQNVCVHGRDGAPSRKSNTPLKSKSAIQFSAKIHCFILVLSPIVGIKSLPADGMDQRPDRTEPDPVDLR